MRIFETGIRRLAVLLLPPFLRTGLLITILQAAATPLVTLQYLFLCNRGDSLRQLHANGQVCYLRRALNDAFPDAGGAIRIEDGKTGGEWVYAWGEDGDTYNKCLSVPDGNSLFVWDESAILAGRNRFNVIVPATLRENEDGTSRLRAILNTYKLPSKSYTIIYEQS